MHPRIRPATEADCPAIATITNDAITGGVAHFATEPDTPAGVAAWWSRDRTVYPWFVAVDADTPAHDVIGFARASRWKSRSAYDWTCETAIYLRPRARGMGIGRMLYEELFEELARRGFRCIIAGMTVPNPASSRLHEAMGMRTAGTFPAVGFKMGAWHDVRYYVKVLGDGSPPPGSPGLPGRPSSGGGGCNSGGAVYSPG